VTASSTSKEDITMSKFIVTSGKRLTRVVAGSVLGAAVAASALGLASPANADTCHTVKGITTCTTVVNGYLVITSSTPPSGTPLYPTKPLK
jgi:hypothetical protein